MSIIAFLRAVRSEASLPDQVCVLGLERLLHHIDDSRRAAGAIRQALYNPRANRFLRRERPVVILPLEYLELSTYWKAGIVQHGTPQEIFRVEWVFPRVDIEEIGNHSICYSIL